MLSGHQITGLKHLGLILAHGLLKSFDNLHNLERVGVKDNFCFIDELRKQLLVAELEWKVIFNRGYLVILLELRDPFCNFFIARVRLKHSEGKHDTSEANHPLLVLKTQNLGGYACTLLNHWLASVGSRC